LGKRKVLNEADLKELVLPESGELLGVAVKLMGSDHIMVKCTDGKFRMGRIIGRLKRKIWIREGDVVLVAPWDFKANEKADVVWRYTISQVDLLKANKYLPEEL
jgi:translation initiation factor 1A